MIVFWGSKLYGKTDEVPGIFHVATRFGHVWFIPLIPLGSYLVFETAEGEQGGVAIPFSLKSLLLGWLRAGSFLTALFAGIVALEANNRDAASTALLAAVSLIGFLGLQFGPWFRHSTYERAKQLGEHAGLNATGSVLLDLHFGMADESRAKELLAEAEARDLEKEQEFLDARRASLQEHSY